MMKNETVSEMIRIIRASNRMCQEHPTCDGCPAAKTSCEFTGSNEKLADLIHIIDRYDRECAEHKQDIPGAAESKEAQGIEERLHELEIYRQQMQLWAESIAQRIDKIEDHAVRQDHYIVCNCVHVKMQRKKRTRMEAYLELFPHARMRGDMNVPVVRPCEIDSAHYNRQCPYGTCGGCMERYWNEEVDG